MNDQALRIIVNAVDNASEPLKKIADNVKDHSSAISSGLKTVSVASAAVAAGLTAYSKSAADHVTQMVSDARNLARQTGETEVEASKLLGVMKKLGVEAGEASSMFGIFSKKIVESNQKTGEAADKTAKLNNEIAAAQIEISKTTEEIKKNGDATGELHNKIDGLQIKIRGLQSDLTDAVNPLQKLHIATANADGSARAFNDILLEVADRFKDMPDGAEKTALAMQLFGRSGKDMIRVLNQGSQGIQDLEANAEKLGLTLTDKNIATINEYVKSTKAMREANESLRIQVGLLTAPLLTEFNNKLNETTQALIGTDSPFRGLIANVLAFGGPIMGAVSGLVGFGANAVTILPAVMGGFNAMFNAITIGANTFTLVTIPSMMASLNTFKASVMANTVMGGIAVAGAIADIMLVYDAVQKVKGAIQSLTDAAKASADENRAWADSVRQIQQSTNLSPDEKARRIRALGPESTAPATGFTGALQQIFARRATGGPVNAGNSYVVGEQRPEVFVPNTAGRVQPNAPAAGQTTNILSGTFNFSTSESVDAFFERLDKTQRLTRLGMA